MPEKAVYLLVVEGFADWEPAHAVAELRRQGHYKVESVGLTSAAVRSMGGITVLPSRTVSEVNTSDVAVFILPGGDRPRHEAKYGQKDPKHAACCVLHLTLLSPQARLLTFEEF